MAGSTTSAPIRHAEIEDGHQESEELHRKERRRHQDGEANQHRERIKHDFDPQ